MRIIRPNGITDLYDCMAGVCGIDPLVTLKHKSKFDKCTITSKGGFKLQNFNYINNIENPKTRTQIYYTIVVCGIPYVIRKRLIGYERNTWSPDRPMFDKMVISKEEFLMEFDKPSSKIVDYAESLEKYSQHWVDFHKFYNYPIMLLESETYDKVRSEYNSTVSSVVPMLNDFKFARVKSPMELYLEIQSFMLQLKNTNVPVILSDSDLAIKHGFNKQSFRKRK